MRPRWILRKELAWVRRNAVALLFVLLLVPGASAYAALGFQHVLPTDAPVAVVPQTDATTEDDLAITEGALTSFSEPVRYESRERAMGALERERVYAVVTVPPRLTAEDRDTAEFKVYTDGHMVPYREPSRAVASVLAVSLRQVLPAEVAVERVETGPELTLSEYLVPTFLMMIAMLLSFAYLPYALVREARALDRVRVRSTLLAAVGGKLGTFAVLAVVPLVATALAGAVLGFRVSPLSAGALVLFPLVVVHLGGLAAAVTVASGFSTWGRLVNLALLLGGLTFTGLVYPVGFFSATRRAVIRLVPAHYAMIAARGHVLRDLGPAAYPQSYGVVLAATAASLALLWVAAGAYERRV